MTISDPLGLGRFAHQRFVLLILFLLSAIQQSEGNNRRRLEIDESISEHLQLEHAMNVAYPRFTFAAVDSKGKQRDFDVIEAYSAVTPGATTYSVDGGPSLPVRDMGIKYLVSDPNSREDGGGSLNEFTFVAVDERTGIVRGISQGDDEKPINIAQMANDVAIISDVDEFTPPEWTCGVHDDIPEDFIQTQNNYADEGVNSAPLPFVSSDAEAFHFHQRDLDENHDEFMNHDHNHVHESHSGHAHLSPNDMKDSTFATLMNSLKGELVTKHPRRINDESATYLTDNFPAKWSYQVNVFIEIDDEFVTISGGGDENKAIEYINILITAISALCEKEMDTHLHVEHIAKTSVYQNSNSTQQALDLMVETYGNDEAWHYPNIDVHHALLGKNLRGGMAKVAVLCRPDQGFALSTQISGKFESIDAAMMWDFLIVAHEFGHTFGSYHTHSPQGYNPLVDTCGIKNSDGKFGCSSSDDFPSPGSATIMGYCHICPGNMNNLAYTFGGQWAEDNRHDIENWNNNIASGISVEPRRVSKTIWEHVSSRGTCVSTINTDVPTFDCNLDIDCSDGNSCTDDTCIAGKCNNVPKDKCCGNFICEPGEAGSCSDCGPFTLSAPLCQGSCWVPEGIMFDISTINDIVLHGISFRVHSRNGNVASTFNVYTAPRSYSDIYDDRDTWTEIYSGQVNAAAWSFVSLDFDGIAIKKASTQALYISSLSASVVASKLNQNPVASDANVKIDHPARYVFQPFGRATLKPGDGTISWEGEIEYSTDASCLLDSHCDDENNCTIDTCDLSTGTCQNIMSNNCCGNEVCEINEEGCSVDCGPWNLDAPLCTTYGNGKCYTVRGAMFEVHADTEVTVDGISIIHTNATDITINFYTAQGSIDDLHSDPLAWDFLGTSTLFSLDRIRWLSFSIPQTSIKAGSTQSFYIVTSSSAPSSNNGWGLYCGSLPANVVADERIELMSPARVFIDSEPFSTPSYARYSFQGGITYRAAAVPEPTKSPQATPSEFPSHHQTLLPSQSAQPSTIKSRFPSTSQDPTSLPTNVLATGSPKPSTTYSSSLRPSLSVRPSTSGSNSPSISPNPTSSQTSFHPTVSPSSIPTNSNSLQPSIFAQPSISPFISQDPTGSPTNPSRTMSPTLNPTSLDSLPPSIFEQPSSSPSHSPSMSKDSTRSPTITPTLSVGPTPSPSHTPTKKPSKFPTTSPSSSSNSAKWFMEWDTLRCLQDCRGDFPCGGKASYWMTLYSSPQVCCAKSFKRSPSHAQKCLVASLKTSEQNSAPANPSDSGSLFNN